MDKNRLAPPSFMSAIPPSWFQSILGALILALLVAIAIRWVKLPYTIALVIVGLVVGWLGEYWMCRSCHNLLRPGVTARVRIRNGCRYTTCLNCGKIAKRGPNFKHGVRE